MRDCNQGSVVSQVELIQPRFAQSPGLPYAELLPADGIVRLLDELGVEYRDRD